MNEKVLIVGIGNDLRGDDGIGLMVARAIEAHYPLQPVKVTQGDVGELMDWFATFQYIVLVDAMIDPSLALGECVTLDLTREALSPKCQPSSTHIVSVAQAIELARVMDTLPEGMIMLGIVGKGFGLGEPIQDGLTVQLDAYVARVMELLQSFDQKQV